MAPRKPTLAPAATFTAPASTRRSARLHEAAAGPATDEKTRVAKPKRAPKPKPQKYDCTTCGRNLAASSFPDHLATDNCKHYINTCKVCTKTYLAVQLDNTTYDKLACPECTEVMQNEDVKRMASKEVYARYDELERRGIAEKVPGWRWCLNPKCRAGQVHELLTAEGTTDTGPGNVNKEACKGSRSVRATSKMSRTAVDSKERRNTKSKLTAERANAFSPDICTCDACGAIACVPCDRPYHDGESCAQYKKRQEGEEKATLETIANECKQCPKCKKNIEKAGGCDAVVCEYRTSLVLQSDYSLTTCSRFAML